MQGYAGRVISAAVMVPFMLEMSACAISQRPPRTQIGQPAPPVPVSSAGLGVKISLSGLADYLNGAIPSQASQSGSDDHYIKVNVCPPFHCWVKTKVCAWDWQARVDRTPFIVRPIDGGLSITSTYRLHGRIKTKLPCIPAQETTEPDGVMTLTVNVRPTVNDLYAVQPNISYDPFHWDVKPGIKLFNYIQVSFGTKAKQAIDAALGRAVAKVNADLAARLDLRSRLAEGWRDLQQPMALGGVQGGWITIRPLSLSLAPVTSDDEATRISLGLRSQNVAVFGPKPPAQEPIDLVIPRHDSTDGRFSLTAIADLDYASVIARAKEEWMGRTIQLDQGRILFRDFRLYQSGDRLVIGADVRANSKYGPYVEGWLYLIGKPEIKDGKLVLADLDYRAKTGSLAVQALAWLFRDAAKRELERKLSFNLDASLAALRERLNTLPPTPIGEHGRLEVRVDAITIGTPLADSAALRVPLTASGRAEAVFFPPQSSLVASAH